MACNHHSLSLTHTRNAQTHLDDELLLDELDDELLLLLDDEDELEEDELQPNRNSVC
jgi:hypothetical protein